MQLLVKLYDNKRVKPSFSWVINFCDSASDGEPTKKNIYIFASFYFCRFYFLNTSLVDVYLLNKAHGKMVLLMKKMMA